MRVLRVLTRANVGGPTRQALDLWHCDAAADLQTLLVVGACAPGEVEMADLARLPTLDAATLTTDSHGVVRASRLGRAARPWRDLLAVHELRRIIRAFAPTVVHTHTTQAGLFGRRAALAERVPVVAHTYHGHVLADYYPAIVGSLLRRMEARLARRTQCLFTVSRSCRTELNALGIGTGRLEVLPPALDLRAFTPDARAAARRRLGCSDRFTIGFVGRLVPVKRPEVFAAVVARLPGVRGVVFGSGPLSTRMPGSADLEMHGVARDLPALVPGLDVLVVCSRREGCPLAALEAFAAGVPVVGFDVPGVRDALADWGAGVLVPERAGVDGLCVAVRELMGDPGRRAGLVAAAAAGLDRFEPARIAKTLRSHYARAADESGLAAVGA